MSGPNLFSSSLSSSKLYRRALLVWLALLALAVVNGILREFALAPLAGAAALPVSGVTALLAFAVVIWLFVRAHRPTPAAALRVGLIWLVLTMIVETLMTLAAGRPAIEVVAALSPHAVAAGNLFAPLLLFIALAPALFARLLHA